jgi:hypothetical protein
MASLGSPFRDSSWGYLRYSIGGGASAASGIRGPEFRCKSSLPNGFPGEFFLSYFVGVILILAGVCLLVNKKSADGSHIFRGLRISADSVYLPILLAVPTDVAALKFFFDTLLFCGAILLLAKSIDVW